VGYWLLGTILALLWLVPLGSNDWGHLGGTHGGPVLLAGQVPAWGLFAGLSAILVSNVLAGLKPMMLAGRRLAITA